MQISWSGVGPGNLPFKWEAQKTALTPPYVCGFCIPGVVCVCVGLPHNSLHIESGANACHMATNLIFTVACGMYYYLPLFLKKKLGSACYLPSHAHALKVGQAL